MASIYELSAEFMTLWQLMEDGTLEDEALEVAFDVAKEDLADKLEGYCKFIKNLEATIAGLKEEEKRLNTRRKTMENTVERAKEAMQHALNVSGEKKMACGTFTVYIQSNPPKCVIDTEIAQIPGKYLVQSEPTVDKKLLLNDLKSEEAGLEGIAHIEQGESLRIK